MLMSVLLALSNPASAAGFQAKTMRAPLSAVEVERGLVIGRGWLELTLAADVKPATGAWSRDGEVDTWEHARWLYTTERAELRYGIMRRAELYASFPVHYVRLTNDALDTDTSTFGIGDPTFGWRLEWLRRPAPLTSIVSDVWFRMPAGSESPGTYIGGPNSVSTFVLSTGTADLGVAARGKQQFGPVAVTASVGYLFRFSGVTQYVIEREELQFAGRFKPGNEWLVSLEPMVQLGPVALACEGALRVRDAARTGTTSAGIFVDRYLEVIEGTDGTALDVEPSVTFNLTRGVDVRGAVNVPLIGEDLMFPLEQVTPTYGLTYSGSVELRY